MHKENEYNLAYRYDSPSLGLKIMLAGIEINSDNEESYYIITQLGNQLVDAIKLIRSNSEGQYNCWSNCQRKIDAMFPRNV